MFYKEASSSSAAFATFHRRSRATKLSRATGY